MTLVARDQDFQLEILITTVWPTECRPQAQQKCSDVHPPHGELSYVHKVDPLQFLAGSEHSFDCFATTKLRAASTPLKA